MCDSGCPTSSTDFDTNLYNSKSLSPKTFNLISDIMVCISNSCHPKSMQDISLESWIYTLSYDICDVWCIFVCRMSERNSRAHPPSQNVTLWTIGGVSWWPISPLSYRFCTAVVDFHKLDIFTFLKRYDSKCPSFSNDFDTNLYNLKSVFQRLSTSFHTLPVYISKCYNPNIM
jgi:hypothetical protein